MKLKVTTKTGEVFTGRSYKEVVLQMARADYISGGKGEYMIEVKNRLKLLYGIVIKVKRNGFKLFIEELDRIEMVKVERS